MDHITQCYQVTSYMLSLFRNRLVEVTNVLQQTIIAEKPVIFSPKDEDDCQHIIEVLVVFLHPGRYICCRQSFYSLQCSISQLGC